MIKSEDVQKIVLRLCDQDLSSRKIMEHLGDQISKTTVNRWIKMCKESGEINLKYSSPERTNPTTGPIYRQNSMGILAMNPSRKTFLHELLFGTTDRVSYNVTLDFVQF